MEKRSPGPKPNPLKLLGAHLARLGYWLWLALASLGTLVIVIDALFVKTSLM